MTLSWRLPCRSALAETAVQTTAGDGRARWEPWSPPRHASSTGCACRRILPDVPETAIYPVRALGEETRALEAAMSACLEEESLEAVHEVRRECNRVEAILNLIEALQAGAAQRSAAQAAIRGLKRLRRAAGRVRDFDMQRQLLKEQVLESAAATPVEPAVVKGSKQLRKICKQGRKKAAKKLLRVITRHKADVSGALHKYRAALHDEAGLNVPAKRLIEEIARKVGQERGSSLEGASPTHLHELRKLAKAGRYQAELGSHSRRVAARAGELKQLQATGGDWHDWYQLTELARVELGKSKPATLEFARREAVLRQAYCELLSHSLFTAKEQSKGAPEGTPLLV